jgi:hypothetical protein
MPHPGGRLVLPSTRRRGDEAPAVDALTPRWRGQTDRVEVWYATLSDPATGLGCWIHHELTSPVEGSPYAHGWTAVFRPDVPPVMERFGPGPVEERGATGAWASVDNAVLDPPSMHGNAGRVAWDLRWEPDEASPDGSLGSAPLFTFPAWAWEQEVLPAAQVVPVPSAPFTGELSVDGEPHHLSEHCTGNLAHIYGHGSAARWGWLHAALGGGDVLEVVSAVSRTPGLNRLPPLAFVQLRAGGRDWPRDPLVAAPLFRTRLGLPTWRVRGTVGRWRLRVDVTIRPERSVRVGYVDPDGATATCTNSELADAEVVLEHRRATWEIERRWELQGSAHAEIGTRP